MDIYLNASPLGKYPLLATFTAVKNCLLPLLDRKNTKEAIINRELPRMVMIEAIKTHRDPRT